MRCWDKSTENTDTLPTNDKIRKNLWEENCRRVRKLKRRDTVCGKPSDLTWKDVMLSRNEIFGFAALWIVLFHVRDNIGMGWFRGSYLLEALLSVGNCGVDIFLFLSAVGLCRSVQTHSTKAFYKNRLLRLCVPYLITAVPYFVWYDFCFAKDGLWQFLLDISTVSFWLEPARYPVWYVSFVVILYALYPLIHHVDVKSRHRVTAAMILVAILTEIWLLKTGSIVYTNAERALSRIPVFLLGVILAPRVLEGKGIPMHQVILAFAAGICSFLMVVRLRLPLIVDRYLYGILAICFVITFSFVKKRIPAGPFRHWFSWLGSISLEIYVVHVFMIRVIRYLGLWTITGRKLFWYLVIPAAAIAGAKLIAMVSARINSRLFRKRDG